MSALKDIENGTLRKALADHCDTKNTLAINAASAATIRTTGIATYTLGGIKYFKAALSAQSIAVTHDDFGKPVGGQNLPAYVQPVLTTAYYLVCLNAAGTVAIVQGSFAGQVQAFPDLHRVFTGTGQIPAEPDNYVAIGLMKVALTGAATFTPGTTLLDAANVAVTYFDLERVPAVAP